jgi:tRNA dimethylallyltransferase
MPNLPPIIIAGPTASGKSEFAEYLCDKINGAIINADSLQVYRGLPQLTAQPVIQKGRHYLYSVFEPWDKCDVARWLTLTNETIELVQQAGKRPIIVGGTGFYLKVLIEGIASIPAVPDTIMQQAEHLLQAHGATYLYEDLKRKDSTLSPHIRLNDTQRVIRAWTVFEATGKTLGEWQHMQNSNANPFVKILCTHDRNVLYERINQRFASMWINGILNEIQRFQSMYPRMVDNYAVKAIGFAEVDAYLKGSLTDIQAIERAQTKTRQYAKRQLTWFRHQFHPDVVLEGSSFNLDAVLSICQ